MKTKEQIENKLKQAKIQKQTLQGCTPGTDGFTALEAAEQLIKVLEWILND